MADAHVAFVGAPRSSSNGPQERDASRKQDLTEVMTRMNSFWDQLQAEHRICDRDIAMMLDANDGVGSLWTSVQDRFVDHLIQQWSAYESSGQRNVLKEYVDMQARRLQREMWLEVQDATKRFHELTASVTRSRDEMRSEFAQFRQEFAAMQEEFAGAMLRVEHVPTSFNGFEEEQKMFLNCGDGGEDSDARWKFGTMPPAMLERVAFENVCSKAAGAQDTTDAPGSEERLLTAVERMVGNLQQDVLREQRGCERRLAEQISAKSKEITCSLMEELNSRYDKTVVDLCALISTKAETSNATADCSGVSDGQRQELHDFDGQFSQRVEDTILFNISEQRETSAGEVVDLSDYSPLSRPVLS